MLPLIIWGAIGGLLLLSRKAPAVKYTVVQQTGQSWAQRAAALMSSSMSTSMSSSTPAAPQSGNLAAEAVAHAFIREKTGHMGHRRMGYGFGYPAAAFATSPTDARPMIMAGHGGGGGGHGGGHGGGGRNWGGRWGGGGWIGPGWWDDGYGPQIVGPPMTVPVPVPVPAMTDDVANVCQWAASSADSKTLRSLIARYASIPAAVSCLSQRLAQIEPMGF